MGVVDQVQTPLIKFFLGCFANLITSVRMLLVLVPCMWALGHLSTPRHSQIALLFASRCLLMGLDMCLRVQVTVVGTKDPELQRANIKMRYNRNPVIGDKFSSRHGQKGVLSQQWKDTDMPYSAATGMRYAPYHTIP